MFVFRIRQYKTSFSDLAFISSESNGEAALIVQGGACVQYDTSDMTHGA